MPEYNPDNPWVVFALDDEEYCVNSAYVESICQPEEMTQMPNNPAHLKGVMRKAGFHVPIIDTRTLLGLETLAETIRDFGVMRQMHVDWIDALRESVTDKVPFNKAVDPHKCKFGRWYDNYHTENIHMNFILAKIDEPHTRIHRLGAEAQSMMARGDWEGANKVYEAAEEICVGTVLPLLDELIDTYKEANRGMVILLRSPNGTRLGLMVDQIERLAPGRKTTRTRIPAGVDTHGGFIADMVLEGDHTLANMDIDQLFSFLGSHASEVQTALSLAGGS